MSMVEVSIFVPAEHERNVFGQFDQHVKKIERSLHVTVLSREGVVKILGSPSGTEKAKKIFENLCILSMRGNTITDQNVDYAIALSMD